jgi:hypothetical protein
LLWPRRNLGRPVLMSSLKACREEIISTEHPRQVAQLIDAVSMALAYDKELS